MRLERYQSIHIGGNRHPSAADWSPSGSFAYGAGNCVAIWMPDDPDLRGVYMTLKGHKGRVNAVRFVPDQLNGQEVLISGATDCALMIWRWSSTNDWTVGSVIKGIHEGSINVIETCPQLPSIFASAAADGTIAIYHLSVTEASVEVEHLQAIQTKPKYYALSIALSRLPGSKEGVALAAGGSSNVISLYVAGSPTSEFKFQTTLSGHENWIRALRFAQEDPSDDTSDLLLASASQDRYIRLWRVRSGEEFPDKSESKTLGLSAQLTNKLHLLRLLGLPMVWSVTFEALLMGHEDWVLAVNWLPAARSQKDLRLLSCSGDNSVAIWAQDQEVGTWNPASRFGELSAMKGSSTATGSAGGIWNCVWGPDGATVAALTKSGSWRVWRRDISEGGWKPSLGISGHTKDVRSISWSPDGGCLFSVSLDQTTRMFAQWERANGKLSWHEFSRPQIHGYDINCIAAVGLSYFVSGADEKLLRVFNEPKAVAAALETLCNLRREIDKTTLPSAANIPVLGLSNKSIDAAATITTYDGREDPDEAERRAPSPGVGSGDSLRCGAPPTEDTLSRFTLWPEVEKLYGHGYEISALAVAPNSLFIATACKASTAEHAVVRLYDGGESWKEIKPPLESHTLTVTSMAFSPTGRELLTVGRDRAWSVFVRLDGKWFLKQRLDRAHTRIVYDCAWITARGDTRSFLTVSRDKSTKLWVKTGEVWECRAALKATVPVTAIGVRAEAKNEKYWVMVGLEDGGLEVYSVKHGEWETLSKAAELGYRVTPNAAVRRIEWRPGGGEVAVSSEDGSIRIYNVNLEE